MTVSISKLRNPSGHQLSKVVLQFALYMTHSLAGVELNKGNWFTRSPLASLREDGQQSGKPRQNMVKRSSVPLQSSTIYFYFPITYPLVTIICSKRPTETEFYLYIHTVTYPGLRLTSHRSAGSSTFSSYLVKFTG